MSAPLIGVIASSLPADESRAAEYRVGQAYIQALCSAGGLPVIIPHDFTGQALIDLFNRLDGFLFTGGGDIDPHLFDGQPHPRVYGIEPERDTLEIALVQLAAGQGKPFLGICRGIQSVNVSLGGTLFTDIADQFSDQLKHDHFPGVPRDHRAHSVQIEADSRLARALGSTQANVNSMHHQGIQRLAPSLRSTAYAPDQLIEAVELPNHPFGLAVQWHPEWLQSDPAQRALFRALVEAAQA